MRATPLVLVLGTAVCASGCAGAPQGPARPHAAKPPAGAAAHPHFHFVGQPEVVFYRSQPSGSWFVTTARINRALPQDAHGIRAAIDVSGASQDIPGLSRLEGTRRCYRQENSADGPRAPQDGQKVTVTMSIGTGGRHRQVLRATVRARRVSSGTIFNDVRNARYERALAQRLDCLAAPHLRRCSDVVSARNLGAIGAAAAGGGATCATARRVMRSVGRWADSGTCPTDLCVKRHRRNAGYRCSVALNGEVSWTITCKRGVRIVRGFTAE
jgi:hypothetical protein